MRPLRFLRMAFDAARAKAKCRGLVAKNQKQEEESRGDEMSGAGGENG